MVRFTPWVLARGHTTKITNDATKTQMVTHTHKRNNTLAVRDPNDST